MERQSSEGYSLAPSMPQTLDKTIESKVVLEEELTDDARMMPYRWNETITFRKIDEDKFLFYI